MNRIAWLSILRGINILLVVMFHVQLIDMSTGLNHAFCQQMTYFFDPLRMPLFIFASGGLLYLSRISKGVETRALYKDKFQRIMIPFVFFVCVYYFFKLLVNQYVKTQVECSLSNFLASFILFESHPSAPLWFLATLMTLMLLYPLFVLVTRRISYALCFLAFTLLLYIIDFDVPVDYNYFYLLKLNKFLVFFYFGIFFFRYQLYKYLDSVAALLASVVCYLMLFYFQVTLLVSLAGIVMMITVALFISHYYPSLCSSFREYIYQIYLLSIPFQAFVELILWKRLFYDERLFFGFYVLSILVGIYVPVLISKLVEHIGSKPLKLCFGLK